MNDTSLPDNDRQMNTKTGTQFSVLVSVVVKATDEKHAEQIVANRLNRWFNEPEQMVRGEFYYGTLLNWNFYEPQVINGR